MFSTLWRKIRFQKYRKLKPWEFFRRKTIFRVPRMFYAVSLERRVLKSFFFFQMWLLTKTWSRVVSHGPTKRQTHFYRYRLSVDSLVTWYAYFLPHYIRCEHLTAYCTSNIIWCVRIGRIRTRLRFPRFSGTRVARRRSLGWEQTPVVSQNRIKFLIYSVVVSANFRTIIYIGSTCSGRARGVGRRRVGNVVVITIAENRINFSFGNDAAPLPPKRIGPRNETSLRSGWSFVYFSYFVRVRTVCTYRYTSMLVISYLFFVTD